MLIKDMFIKPIDREIQGVIIVGQDEKTNMQQELEEYVVTKELLRYFSSFFAAYKKGINGITPHMGVWISGFFGSGKSHFLKILSYLLENRVVGGKHAIDYFIDDHKISDPMVLADMQLATRTPTDTILFNIDSKSDSNGKQDKDAIVSVFLKVFNEMQGYCGSMPYLADLERRLTEAGRYTEYQEKFDAEYGSAWKESRQDFSFIQDTVIDVLAAMDFMSEQAARIWCDKTAEPYRISIEEFAKRVKAYIDSKGNNHHVVFLVDEVGQYIGDDSKLMLNLQTVTEELGKECNGKAWIIVTSQQDIDKVTKVRGNDFSKIQGRFDTRLSLSSANVDDVIKKRILEKKDTASQTLRLLYGQKSTVIKNLIVFNDGVEKKLYSNENNFSLVYPFVPYQFDLLGKVLTSIRTHGASGIHLSEGERSMLAMFKEAAVAYMGQNEGTIIPFHAFYNALENFLGHNHRGVIVKAYANGRINPDKKEKDVFAINVLKTLFMIKYCNEYCNANIDNITSLMVSDINDDRIALRSEVESALKVLISQTLVQKNGDIYVFLTDEEQEINREIESQNVEMADIISRVSSVIFEDILQDNKYRYPEFNGRYSFPFNQAVDARPYKANQSNDIGVRVLTPASDYGTDENTLRMISGQSKEALVVLPDDRAFMDETQSYLKIEKFLRFGAASNLPNFESIKAAKNVEMRERNDNAKLYLSEALKAADIYVNGDKVQIGAKDISGRINDALGRLVAAVYHKLPYIDTPMGEEDIRKLMRTSNQVTMNLDDQALPNVHALDDVLRYIASNTSLHVKTSMKTLKDRFMKAPYGFVEDDVDWLVAKLFKRSDLSFTVNGSGVTLQNNKAEEIINLITKKANSDKLLMEQRVRVSDRNKKIVRSIMNELFHTGGSMEDEDGIMESFQRCSESRVDEIDRLADNYIRYAYPGKDKLAKGKVILQSILMVQTPVEFFQTVSEKENDLLDFAEDFEPIKAFFKGEQKEIFTRSLDMLAIYDNSKVYIVNTELESIVRDIRSITKEEKPYGDIPRLPELRDMFMRIYHDILIDEQKPVFTSIDDAEKRVLEETSGKEYLESMESGCKQQFAALKEAAKRVNDVSLLRGYSDRATALRDRILAQIYSIELEKAKNEKEKAAAVNQPNGQTPAVIPPKPKRRKSVAIRSVTHTSSWRIENEADIDRYIEELRSSLKGQLEENTIINIEF